MRTIRGMLGIVVAFLSGSLATMAAFGLCLAVLQSLPWSDATAYELGSTIASAAIAIASGGFAVSAVARTAKWAASAFGLLFGVASFGYIFGASWLVIPSTGVAVLLSAAGGGAAGRLLAKRNRPAESNAA